MCSMFNSTCHKSASPILWETLGATYKHSEATADDYIIWICLPDDLASRCLAALCFNVLLCDRNALTESTDRERFWHGRGGSLGCRTPSAELAVRGRGKESHRAGHLCVYKANSSMCWNQILNFLCHKKRRAVSVSGVAVVPSGACAFAINCDRSLGKPSTQTWCHKEAGRFRSGEVNAHILHTTLEQRGRNVCGAANGCLMTETYL